MGAVVALALLVVIAARAQAQTTLTWSAPVAIDGTNGDLHDISCSSPSLCIAIDASGELLTSTDPAGGAGAWNPTTNFSEQGLTRTACTPSAMCVIGDASGDIFVSTDPTNGSSWTGGAGDGLDTIVSMSCASDTLCVAGDASGNVSVSTNPTGGPGTWSATTFGLSDALNGLSCAPGTTQCVGGDAQGNVFWSDDPTNPNAWTIVTGVSPGSIYSVSCPVAALCVMGGAGATDNLLTATDPTGDATAWTAATIDSGNGLFKMSCATVSFCVTADTTGDVAQSSDPTGGAAAWTATDVDGTGNLLSGLSCPTTSFCAVVDQNNGNLILGTGAPHSLTVVRAGAGSGSVTSAPAGIACPGQCAASFSSGTTVTLTASASAGSTFAGWSGGGCSGTGACTVTLTADTAVTATFGATPASDRSLTVRTAGSGAGTVTSAPAGISCGSHCVADYASGTAVALTAAAAHGSRFAGWSGAGCGGRGVCHVTLGSDEVITATFTGSERLTVTKTGPGSGTVTSTPTGIDCGGTCTAGFPAATTVVLFPTASAGSAFGGWSGGGCHGLATCRVTMTAAKHVTATFVAASVKPGPPSTNGNSINQGYSCSAAEPCYVVASDDCDLPKQCVGAQAGPATAAAVRGPVALAGGRFRIPAHGHRQVSLRLTAKGRKLVRAHHRLKMIERITVTAGHKRSVITRTLVLTDHPARH